MFGELRVRGTRVAAARTPSSLAVTPDSDAAIAKAIDEFRITDPERPTPRDRAADR